MNWLLALIIILVPAAAQAAVSPCEAGMSGQAPRPFQLGIGVLIEDIHGQKIMGVSPYAGALHKSIVDTLRAKHVLKRVLWMGELRFRGQSPNLEILEANETSGFSKKLKDEGGLVQDGRVIPVESAIQNIPHAWKGPNYRGHRFRRWNQRLAKELNAIKEDIRHEIDTAFSMMTSTLTRVAYNLRPQELPADLASLHTEHKSVLVLLPWLIQSLTEDGRLSVDEVPNVRAALEILKQPIANMEDLRKLDLMQGTEEILLLADITRQIQRPAKVTEYPLR